MAVFSGGASFDAVSALCDDITPSGPLEALSSLVAKSLVVADTGGAAPARYRLLETVRAYATDRLVDAGDDEAVATRHARWFFDLAEQAKPNLTGPHPEQWVGCLAADYDNLVSALRWTLTHGDCDEALQFASSLTFYWRLRGPFSEGRRLLEAALAHGAEASPALRAEGLWGAGFMAVMQHEFAAAETLVTESLGLYHQLDDTRGQGRALLLLGIGEVNRVDLAKARQLLAESAALARPANDAWCVAHALYKLAWVELSHGDAHEARRLSEEALGVAREAHEPQALLNSLILGCSVAALQGDYGRAETLAAEALVLTDRLTELPGRAAALKVLAKGAAGRGAYWQAQRLLEQAATLNQRAGGGGTMVGHISALGQLSLHVGDLDRAERLLTEALTTIEEGDGAALPILSGLAVVAVSRGDDRRFALKWGA